MSAKMGRPKIDNPNKINLTVRLNAELVERLDKYCQDKSVSKGEVVRKGIESVLAADDKK